MNIKGVDVANVCKRRPLLMVCVVVCVILGAALYLRSGRVTEIEATLEDRSKLLRKLEANVKNAAQLEEQTEALREVNKRIREAALQEGELALNQQLFLRLEAETGVKLVDLRPQPVPPPAKNAKNAKSPSSGEFMPMRFSLSVTGTYQNLIAFMKRLESGESLAKIANASMAFSVDPKAEQIVSMSVVVIGIRK
jgi:Tfp pilus assembly protein PilO